MSIPLVQEATKDAINTSIIAIKRNIERINMLLGLVDSGSPDLSGLATKQELEDAITQVETDLAPVDEVTSGNMHSVTSNGVAKYLNTIQTWSKNGVVLHKIGRFVYGLFSYTTSGSSPISITTVPYKPVEDVRITLINNTQDSFAGQFVIYANDGSVRLWKGEGSFSYFAYNCSFMYIAQL